MGKSPQSKAIKKVEKSTSSKTAASQDQFSLRAAANEDLSSENHVWSLDDEDSKMEMDCHTLLLITS